LLILQILLENSEGFLINFSALRWAVRENRKKTVISIFECRRCVFVLVIQWVIQWVIRLDIQFSTAGVDAIAT